MALLSPNKPARGPFLPVNLRREEAALIHRAAASSLLALNCRMEEAALQCALCNKSPRTHGHFRITYHLSCLHPSLHDPLHILWTCLLHLLCHRYWAQEERLKTKIPPRFGSWYRCSVLSLPVENPRGMAFIRLHFNCRRRGAAGGPTVIL